MTDRLPALLRLAAAAALSLALGGCVSLVPKQKPSQLYRFGGEAQVTAPAKDATPAGERVGVFRALGTFQREAAGDRLLTLTGDKAAYIARARWVAPAEVLFDETVLHAFDASGRVRLVSRGEAAKADSVLRLDVRNFETRYVGKAPSVVVRMRAVLRDTRRSDVAEHIFEAEVPAGDNRVGAIVAAYDEALGQVLKELVAWVETSAAA